MGKGRPSSAAKLPSGASVPDVSTMARGPCAASARIATPALKHQYDSTGASATASAPAPRRARPLGLLPGEAGALRAAHGDGAKLRAVRQRAPLPSCALWHPEGRAFRVQG